MKYVVTGVVHVAREIEANSEEEAEAMMWEGPKKELKKMFENGLWEIEEAIPQTSEQE